MNMDLSTQNQSVYQCHVQLCLYVFMRLINTVDFILSSGSLYVFKGSSYWKFAHPGSAPEKGYPRPVATDWLDCPDPATHYTADGSLTSTTGQLELQKKKQSQGAADQIRHRDKTIRPMQHRKDCHCFSKASKCTLSLLLMILNMFLQSLVHIYSCKC